MCDTNVKPISTLVAVAHALEVDWTAYEYRLLFRCIYKVGIFVVLPAVARTMPLCIVGVEVAEGSQLKLRPKHYAGRKDCGAILEFARRTWQDYFANRVRYFELPSLATQEAAIRRADRTEKTAVVAEKVVGGAKDVKILKDDDDD